jgi:Ca2+/H+ antiporter
MEKRDCEFQKPTQLSHFAQVFDQAGITPEVEAFNYKGSGTEEDPYIVDWITQDPRNPMLYDKAKRWTLTMIVAIATLAVALVSSAYSGGAEEVIREFGCSQVVFTLGIGESSRTGWSVEGTLMICSKCHRVYPGVWRTQYDSNSP